MPPKAPSPPSDPQHALFKAILMNLKSAPDVDWAAVVADSGYSSISSAKERFRQHRVACGAVYGKAGRDKMTPTAAEIVPAKPAKGNLAKGKLVKEKVLKAKGLGNEGKKALVREEVEENVDPWTEKCEQDKAEHGAGVQEYGVGDWESGIRSEDEYEGEGDDDV